MTMKKKIVSRILISSLLSFIFKLGITIASRMEVNQLTLKVANCICSIIVVIPIFPLLKIVFIDSKFKSGKWIILKMMIIFWLSFLVISNIYIITNEVAAL